VVDEHFVVLVDAASIEQKFLEVPNILLDNVSDLLELSKLVPVMILEHALGADKLMANTAKILDLFVLVLEAEDTGHIGHLRLCRFGGSHNNLGFNRRQL